MSCPNGYHDVISVSSTGALIVKCVADYGNTDEQDAADAAAIQEQERLTRESKQRADAVNVNLILAKRNRNLGDTYHYPTQTIDPNYPYQILGQVSRANQKANVFTKAFNPANRKIIVLMIAGFLLFIAFTNSR